MSATDTIIRAFHEVAVVASDDRAAENAAHAIAHALRAALPPSHADANLILESAYLYVRSVRLAEKARVFLADCKWQSLDIQPLRDSAAILRAAEASRERILRKAIDDLCNGVVRLDPVPTSA